MEITKNFDWSDTERKLCVFIPNFGKKEQLEFAIKNMKTEQPTKDWIVIIGNDGIDIDFDYLKQYNVRYFTLPRDPAPSRNGAFIRNYFIKRCQSERILQKDPEVILQGDFIKRVSESPRIAWRAGNIYVLNRGPSAELMEEGNLDILKYSTCIKIDPIQIHSPKHAKWLIAAEDGRVNFSSYFHYAYAVKTKILRDFQGYDERYLYYGYEDSDMFCRLLQEDQYLCPDYEITAIHLHHDRDPGWCIDQVNEMKKVFFASDPTVVKRNNENWGEG